MNVVKSISYDNTDIQFHNISDSAIINLCVTLMTNVIKSNKNFVVKSVEVIPQSEPFEKLRSFHGA